MTSELYVFQLNSVIQPQIHSNLKSIFSTSISSNFSRILFITSSFSSGAIVQVE